MKNNGLSIKDAIEAIRNRSSSISLKVEGEICDDDIVELKNAMVYSKGFLVSIDLTEVIGLKALKDEAFADCEALSSLSLPSSVESIGKEAFAKCNSLVSFVVPDGVSKIEKKTFSKCKSLKSVVLPQNLTVIGKKAFKKCVSLSSIELPPKLCYIKKSAFYGCKSLESISIPENLIVIDEQAFGQCLNLKQFLVQNSFAYSSQDGILYNKNKTKIIAYPSASGEIKFAEGVKEIDSYALAETRVTSVIIPDGATSIGVNAFANCELLRSVVIPDTVTSIGAWAFSGCRSLYGIKLPLSLTQIGDSAFRSCAIKSIVLPDN